MTLVDDAIRVIIQEMVQQTVNAPIKTPQQVVWINGVVTPAFDITVRHGVDQPIGTLQVTIEGPIPAHVVPGATVEVQLGYVDHMFTVFTGRIPQRRVGISMQGRRATIVAASHGSVLARQDYTDVEYAGPISLRALFQAMCARRQVPNYLADNTTYVDFDTNSEVTITFGNNADANEQKVVVPRKTTSLSFIQDAARLFGYRVFDTPSGTRLKRISGLPEGVVMLSVEEGVNPLELTYSDDIATIVNYREVFGADYTDTDGVRVPIRSIAASIPTNPLIYPDGWRRDEVSSELIDTYELADAVRNIYEIDFGAAHELVAWETHGVPHLLPGDVAHVTSDTLGIDEDLWVMSVQHTFNGRGFRTRCEGWRGAGVALPAGNDCVTTAIPGGPWHMGDEYLTHYAHPNPMGLMVKVPFAVAQGYSSIAIRGLAHGTNSYLLNNQNAEADVSRFEIWQFGEEVGRGSLPVLDENLNQRYPYGSSDTYWSRFVVPISGSLEADPTGANTELRIISGRDTRASGGPQDDWEVKNLTMTTCGIGSPVIGGEV